MAPASRPPFDKKLVSRKRKSDKACDKSHPGMCKSSPVFASAQKAARQVFDWVRESVPLSEIGSALFLATPPACDLPF